MTAHIAAADDICKFTWVVLCDLKETLNTLYTVVGKKK